MKKCCTYIILFCSLFFNEQLIIAQQKPQHSLYLFNTQLYNPSTVSSRDYLSLTLNSRVQWNGIQGSPETHAISAFKNFKQKNIGIGVSFLLDRIGPQSQKDYNVDLSYSIQPTYGTKLAFGVKLGTKILDINFNKFEPKDPDDPLLQPIESTYKPSFGSGMYWYSNKWYFGVSALNLLHTKHYNSSNHTDRPHYYIQAGYVYEISRSLKIKPAALTKITSGSPANSIFSLNILYDQSYTAGISYNNGETLSFLISADLGYVFTVAYAFDYPLNTISEFSTQTHEIVLSYRFVKNKKECDCEATFF